ncbi:F-box/kelch-repeat protein [Cardamine amara subsp. amara]|uniref:F-box/kelch-repeat protein n=1 Tax=Cardamine amara subsp. amara TaxID=228776 RepID=A0ABD1BQ10_CARAN
MSQEIGTNFSLSEPKKLIVIGGMKPNIPHLNAEHTSILEEEIIETVQNLSDSKDEDANYVFPKLLFELEVEVFSRIPYFQFWKLNFLNKEFSKLLQSGEIFRWRRERGLVQPYVFVFSNGEKCWKMFDKDFKNFRKLPRVPSDCGFLYGEKETISAGTHLIIIGSDVKGIEVWRYELEMHKWIKDTAMITPRTKFGSASRGSDAFFAGGTKRCKKGILEVVNVAEKYNADTKRWTLINGMHKRRKFSSGCFLRGKFFVLGGLDENGKYLTCGESYDEMTDSWKLVPDMLKDMNFMSPQSLPLIAVVKDNLYLLEKWSKEVRVYDINANVWKKLGVVPVKVNPVLGWGVTFNSIGDKLMVIGASSADNSWKTTFSIYICHHPSPNVEELLWEEYKHCCDGVQLGHFIRNCCVMIA